jgi:hypothetical protein
MDRADLTACLQIGMQQAKEVISVLQLEGYIEPAGTTTKWRTTDAGRTVSGAKTDRFTGQCEAALNALHDRIHAMKADPNATHSLSKAVAFGDSLRELPREYRLHLWGYDWNHAKQSRPTRELRT